MCSDEACQELPKFSPSEVCAYSVIVASGSVGVGSFGAFYLSADICE